MHNTAVSSSDTSICMALEGNGTQEQEVLVEELVIVFEPELGHSPVSYFSTD